MNLLYTLELEPEIIGNCQKSKHLFGLVRFKGSSSTQSIPTTSANQQAVEGAIGDFLTPRIGTGATPFTGQLTPDVPDLVGDAFSKFEAGLDRALTSEERSSLSGLAKGESFFEADPEQIIQDWRENFANPLTSYYNEFVRPEVREEFNVPGGFNTSERSQGVSRAFNEFYGGQVAPTLFQAQENERQREFAAQSQAKNLQLPALQYSQNLPSLELGQAFQGAAGFQSFQQPALTARYNEFLRTALENDPFTRLGLGFATTPTIDTVVDQGSDKSGLGSAIGGLAGIALAAPTGGLSLAAGGALGAGIGGGIGSAF